ncbi:MAG: hypothetical protein US60_C0017G0019 [Microgenomates group bacterium GW2011_GWC1_37_8]|uniref:Cupin 2 conserved barrel domain-containing protein n=1 Tax=Candidatus Woesebacteria bacterium GW2011_GWB1_38_8 TaxID=1618570 RepID=A0A0G0L596_9BACT|nr:MAG: hypothetical protein US60_C0017G0019 [Microgenomates group bacterium GW2011_GWC1_37_8]KKQ86187.1 MAG: hypothetical protein UT08_C0001G0053 [Candidatus Woesebacteria bacterium GW2011_GWB1_38_8]
MNVQKVVEELKRKYPGKNIVVDNEDGYQEIICEIEPTNDHPKRSIALVVVGEIRPHMHKTTTEIYEVFKGKLRMFIDGKTHVLGMGQRIEIKPGHVHYGDGEEVWFKTYSTPGWTPEDHILV